MKDKINKNVITEDDLIHILVRWRSKYVIKKNHGAITLVELVKEYNFADETVMQQMMILLGKLYPYLNFDCNILNNHLTFTASVRKENIQDFLGFKSKLKELEEKWIAIGVIQHEKCLTS
ncbi:MAG TPA: hypothetical protein VNM69_03795 [Bacillus sp. (in: firmicutes)]|nr:hypothetical protein [Bacillus sp. (in: firmicutes)]